MNSLEYTSVYQMTYLFLETVRGQITNNILNDSFQPFVVDLNSAVVNKEKDVLESVQDSIESYFESMIDDQSDVDNFISLFKETLKSLGLAENEDVVSFFEKTLKELLVEIVELYTENDLSNDK
jgi:hypothetical protein